MAIASNNTFPSKLRKHFKDAAENV